jgi:hypothetical protein
MRRRQSLLFGVVEGTGIEHVQACLVKGGLEVLETV